jgi:hypothetical protein
MEKCTYVYLEKIGYIKCCGSDQTNETHFGGQMNLLSYNGIPFDSSKIMDLNTVTESKKTRNSLKQMKFEGRVYQDCIVFPTISRMPEAVVSVFNSASRLVYTCEGISSRIALKKRLSPGFYFIHIKTPDKLVVFRSVVSK